MFCAGVFVCMCMFKISVPPPRALPSSSQLAAFCCDFTAKDQTEAETRASEHGRVVKERQETRIKEEKEKRQEDKKRDFNVSYFSPKFMYAAHYTILSCHWKLCV